MRPSKSLGQNFLADPNLARAIVADAGIQPGDHVLEIGAGLGSLTQPLARSGGTVLAVEFDRGLIEPLRRLAAEASPGTIDVLEADATDIDWGPVLGEHRWVMVSNLPYNVATPLLLGMLQARLPIDRYIVMVQKEVGDRLIAGPGEDAYGAPSVRVAYHASARRLRKVPPEVFWPEPKISSVIVELVPHEPPVAGDEDAIFAVVREAFSQRRKTMRAALRRLGLDTARADAVLAACSIPGAARPEDLGLAEFAALASGLARS